MREILFRGKKIYNGEWVEGGILCTENWASIFVCKDYQGSLNEAPYSDVEEIDVIPETVGQYTGLNDKNGNKVFEGDILEFTNSDNEKTLYEIRYSKFTLAWYICQCDDENAWDNCEFWVNERFEVIGNIHDNHELLEVLE